MKEGHIKCGDLIKMREALESIGVKKSHSIATSVSAFLGTPIYFDQTLRPNEALYVDYDGTILERYNLDL